MINQQELADAVERLREGDDNGLLVKYHDVVVAMASDREQMEIIVDMMLDDSPSIANDINNDLFEHKARKLLREAYRTKLEHGAGL